jgi:hypothetical protein
MSRFRLAPDPRHLPPWHIFIVRSISSRFIEMHRQTTRYRSPAGVAQRTGSACIFTGHRIDSLGLEASPCSPGEQTRRPDPAPTKQIRAASLSNSSLRISEFGCRVDARSARLTTKSRNNKRSPNKAMEPTPVNVTFPAYAGTAPFTSVAHLRR